jgi:hypothetical protein
VLASSASSPAKARQLARSYICKIHKTPRAKQCKRTSQWRGITVNIMRDALSHWCKLCPRLSVEQALTVQAPTYRARVPATALSVCVCAPIGAKSFNVVHTPSARHSSQSDTAFDCSATLGYSVTFACSAALGRGADRHAPALDVRASTGRDEYVPRARSSITEMPGSQHARRLMRAPSRRKARPRG